jgi:hypothetical protein
MICGHEPDTTEHREADHDPVTGCLYCATGEASGCQTVLRPVRRIHSQPSLPDCTGESIAACIEAQAGGAVSGRDLWAEGLRRCGRVPSLETGLPFVPALVGLELRGWCAYRDGEELELPPAKPDLSDELDAADSAGHVVTRYRIPAGPALPDTLADALAGELDAAVGMLVTGDYQAHRPPQGQLSIVGPEMLGTRGDPHAQRVVGYVVINGRRYWLLQNSWSVDWGGALVNGVWVRGCALVSEACLLSAYDCHVIGVRRV